MKVFILSLAVVLMVSTVQAQNTQNRPSTSRNSQERVPTMPDTAGDIRDRLIQLAIQNPSVEIDDRNILVAEYGVKKAKTNILNQISLQGNLNEFSINQNNPYANLYPKYNVGVVVPLGLFTTR